MEIRRRFHKNIAVLYISGDINIDSAPFIEETGRFIKDSVSHIVCDFTNVEMMDYSGLSVIMIAYKNVLNQGGMIKFCNVSPHIKNLLKASDLDAVLGIYPDEESAIKSFDLSDKVDKLYLRRRFGRLDLSVIVKYKLSLSSESKFLKGRLLNLSGEGAFVHSKNTFPVGTDLYLEISLNAKKNALPLMTKVIWLADKELQPHSYPGMGLKFLNMNKTTQDEIIEFIDKNVARRASA